MVKSTLIAVESNGNLLYEYKGYRYIVKSRERNLKEQHRKYRDKINLMVQKENLRKARAET